MNINPIRWIGSLFTHKPKPVAVVDKKAAEEPVSEVKAAQNKINAIAAVLNQKSEVGETIGLGKIKEALYGLYDKIIEFKKMDLRPKDEKIAELEFILLTGKDNIDAARAKFSVLDKDKDGYINLSEFLDLSQEDLNKVEQDVKAMIDAASVIEKGMADVTQKLGAYLSDKAPVKETNEPAKKVEVLMRNMLDIKKMPSSRITTPIPGQMY